LYAKLYFGPIVAHVSIIYLFIYLR
jgi:hypothetical protein